MKIIYSILGVLFVVVFVMRISSTPQSCLVSEAGDSEFFGSALALSDRYLAVGDRKANRVVIYTRNDNDKWVRTKEILPPKGSEAQAAGSGFGSSLALDKETLVIGAHDELNLDVIISRSQEDYRRKFVSGVFVTDLGKQSTPVELSSKFLPNNAIYGFDVSIDDSLVAFGIRKEVSPGIWHGSVGIFQQKNPVEELRIIESPESKADVNFGISTDIDSDLLLVAAPRSGVNGSAYLFNLKDKSTWKGLPNDKDAPLSSWFGGQVALSNSMALLGGNSGSPLHRSSALISMPSSQTNTIRYLMPGGYVAVHENFGVVASARPTPLSPSSIPDDSSDHIQALIIIDNLNLRKVMLSAALNNESIDFISVAVSDNFVSITRREKTKGCKVFIFPQEYLLSISQSYP